MKKSTKIIISILTALLVSVLAVVFLNGISEFIVVVVAVEAASLYIMSITDNLKTKGQRLIESARAGGRVVTAQLVKHKFISGSMERSDPDIVRKDHYNCVYEYTVGGQTYSRKYTTYDYPSKNITLYYSANKPGKAIASQEDMIVSYAARMFTPIAIGAAVYGVMKLAEFVIPIIIMVAENIRQ